MTLLDRHGHPLVLESSRNSNGNFAKPSGMPVMGDKFGVWAGRDVAYNSLPGGAMLQFDLSALTLADFRAMRDHYQINASLSVLSFILHQIDWKIECEDAEITNFITDAIYKIWTELIRALSQGFWAGFSPSVLKWENIDNYISITGIKDLVPEECKVHWKQTPGYAPPGRVPPMMLTYDGIDQMAFGRYSTSSSSSLPGSSNSATITIPAENTLWWPVMRENGDYYGRKMLKPAFPAWYFSQIIHLFANRYYERFGEPTAIGRANFDDRVDLGNSTYVSGKQAMEDIMINLRSRSVVVLPSDRDPVSKEYEYDLSFLESQMRGVDFERYLGRLDEEMSLAVFTPMLLFRTADVGSYNLGQQHMKVFLWMLNSVAGDIQQYIQKYIVDRLRLYNFGANSPTATWVYRRLGKDDTQVLSQMLQALVSSGTVRPDLEELGAAIGIPLHEVEQLATTDPAANPGDALPPRRNPDAPSVVASAPASLGSARQVISEGISRAYRSHLNGKKVDAFGHGIRLQRALIDAGADTDTAAVICARFKNEIDPILETIASAVDSSERFRDVLGSAAMNALEHAAGGSGSASHRGVASNVGADAGGSDHLAPASNSFKPNASMRKEAERGLAWRREYGRGGTAIGVARARDISNGRELSLSTVRRMHSYFSRHEVDKQGAGWSPGEGFPSPGRIAWALWGGDPGRSWARSIVERYDGK